MTDCAVWMISNKVSLHCIVHIESGPNGTSEEKGRNIPARRFVLVCVYIGASVRVPVRYEVLWENPASLAIDGDMSWKICAKSIIMQRPDITVLHALPVRTEGSVREL